MEIINPSTTLQENRQLLVIAHLSQLLNYVTGFGGLLVPLVIWLIKKDSVLGMEAHGKAIINFQLSMLLYAIISIPAILLLGLGILGLITVGILSLVVPIVNAIKATNGEEPKNYMTIRFIA